MVRPDLTPGSGERGADSLETGTHGERSCPALALPDLREQEGDTLDFVHFAIPRRNDISEAFVDRPGDLPHAVQEGVFVVASEHDRDEMSPTSLDQNPPFSEIDSVEFLVRTPAKCFPDEVLD